MSTTLDGIDLDLITKIQRIHAAMAALGFQMTVTDGFRTLEKQQRLYAQGRTAPGKIVTNADGVTNVSNHQKGRAVDCCFLDAQGRPSWAESYPLESCRARSSATS